ncbi:TPA: flagellin [Bacillus cereus]|uniref:flagellin N-terminal helical domain-containing protein n=1 Tax=Bacillus TaxID=1386 RepID=UPI0019253BFD|nr:MULTISPECIES: flagellin [Bacillus]MBL3766136.1 flagellin [Bacillus cereus]MBL3772223.1 flagellin [Bacillus cereus]MBL3776812.1 flagellin [Bacillus cereus]MBL3789170.1 flagellin [Bacillus cereus]MDH7998877.1 flagellin [Bacillus cereus]
MRINTNINSMRTQEYMRQNQAKMSNAMDRLSSGKRINNASDDAAGLAIATRMRARESGLSVAANNTQDGMALIRTADSAMNSVSNILLRMRDIANQSANGTNTNKNQIALQKEFGELQKQIDYISSNTQFNDKNLLDGSNSTINIQTLDSEDGSRQIGIELGNVSTKALGIDTLNIGSEKVTQQDLDNVDDAMDKLATASTATPENVAAAKTAFDKIKHTLSAADAKTVEKAFENYDIADSGAQKGKASLINDAFDAVTKPSPAKVSKEAYEAAKEAITGLTATSNADQVAAAQKQFDNIKSHLTKDQRNDIQTAFNDFDATLADDTKLGNSIATAFTTAMGSTDPEFATKADDQAANPLQAIQAIDAALKTIADNRATLGATLNRLDFNVNNLKSQSSAMASAASQIEDADMAKEMSEMTKFKILNEAGISMLSQANQTPQMVSKLLQ